MNEKSANNLKKPKLFNKKGKILCINRLAEPEKSKIDYIWRFIVISVLLIIFGYLTSLGVYMLTSGQEINIRRFLGFTVAEIFAVYYFIINLIYVTGYIESWNSIEFSENRITYFNSSKEPIFSKTVDQIRLIRFRTKKRKVPMSIFPISRTEGYFLTLIIITKFGRIYLSGPISEAVNWAHLEKTKVDLKKIIRSGEYKALQKKFGI